MIRLVFAGVVVGLGAVVALAAGRLPAAEDHGPQAVGVEILALRSVAGGRMLDLRYRVVDPERARVGLAGEAWLVDAAGRVHRVPSPAKVGGLRPRPRDYRAGATYYALFENLRAAVRPGDRVTVVLGHLRAEALEVE